MKKYLTVKDMYKVAQIVYNTMDSNLKEDNRRDLAIQNLDCPDSLNQIYLYEPTEHGNILNLVQKDGAIYYFISSSRLIKHRNEMKCERISDEVLESFQLNQRALEILRGKYNIRKLLD
jgi:hypothetical protein